MKVSVVIPMLNEAAHIARTIDSIKVAAERARLEHEVVVVDNGSTDEGAEIAAQCGARILVEPKATIASLRNAGAAVATGDTLAFVDADMQMPEEWLEIWLRCRQAGAAEVLGLVHVAPQGAPWYARAWSGRMLAKRSREGYSDFLPSSNLCISRADFERVGGFDPSLITGEDKDLTMRLRAAGARLLSIPAPLAMHWGYERTIDEWLRKEFWRQSSHVALIAKSAPGDLRIWRFPLLALAHLLANAVAVALVLGGQPLLGAVAFVASLLPSLLLTIRFRLNRRWGTFPALWLLHWLRLHLTGVSVLVAAFEAAKEKLR